MPWQSSSTPTEVRHAPISVLFRGADLHMYGLAVELATAPLDGMILPGVTCDSVLTLAREHASGQSNIEGLPDKLRISERAIPMKEVQEAAAAGTLVEFFGTGASFVRPIT